MGISSSRSEASSTSTDLSNTVREFYLQCLEGAAKSIRRSTDAQFELVQNFFDNKDTLKQPTSGSFSQDSQSGSFSQDSQGGELTTQNLNDHEQKILAYIQDDICIQAEVLHNTVTSLRELVNKSVSSSEGFLPYKKTADEFLGIGGRSVQHSENINQKRLELIDLRVKGEELRRKLTETERCIEELSRDIKCPSRRDLGSARKSRPEISGKITDGSRQKNYQMSKQVDQSTNRPDELSQTNSEISKLESNIMELQKQVKRLSAENEKLKKEKSSVNEKVKNLEKDISDLKMRKDQLDAESSSWGGFFQRSSRYQKVSVQLYVPRRGDLLNTVMHELTAMLKTQFQTQDTHLDVIDCESAPQIVPGMPVLVVCINTSRLGTDVTNALTGITVWKSLKFVVWERVKRPMGTHGDEKSAGSPQVAVVILHHKEIHALPNQSSDRILTSLEYKGLGAIIDMAFLSSKGLYTCDMNNNAVSVLVTFIKQRNMP